MKFQKGTNLRFVGFAVLLIVALLFQNVNFVSAQSGGGSETISETTFFADEASAMERSVGGMTSLHTNFDSDALNTTPPNWSVETNSGSRWGVTNYVPTFTPTTGASNSPTSALKKLWVSAGGATPIDPAISTYPAGLKTTIRYQLDLTKYTTAAWLTFWYYNDSEDCSAPGLTDGDYFRWGVSENETYYVGYQVAGFSGGWKKVTINLASFLGTDYRGKNIWIAFQFESDGDANSGDGAYIDDVKLVASGRVTLPANPPFSGSITESGYGTNVGGTWKGGTFFAGDTSQKQAIRMILSFNTTRIKPIGSRFTSVKLRIRYSGASGNSFTTSSLAPFNGMKVFAKNGFFGTIAGYQPGDFNEAGTYLGYLPNDPTAYFYTKSITIYQANILLNHPGVAQFRLQFAKKTDLDTIGDWIVFTSPQLVVTYRTP